MASMATPGRPRRFPLALAFLNPAFTLSAIRERSNSATAPKTVNIILPVGALVSTCSERETNSIPRALKVSSARSRWETERANLSVRPLRPIQPRSVLSSPIETEVTGLGK